ncbi:conserved hypothetical protein [Leishmania major strain Friedlin]|uniref:DUF4200 domain-containing protein n=1 Tax=Leishmania major TaxID=5664 RepID=Q4Q578_LEIMA|nr:conserved hypothetical protein [Leishmania major strain Friedlin]CAG9580331.1 Domain_of_unknown_function_(DUF4200)_-_putative [Leishmania major strain Friedlin]CAJ08724.1 conserved hypothetical protein [Leishmania major strain Friedlin]|eukprot:XP_001685520.1 conserved hypothetical protein [Leishmania major strain Friedlin]
MDLHAQANPFNDPPDGGVYAESSHISKELLREVRRADAAMADDLVVLAPRYGRVFRPGASKTSAADGVGASGAISRATASSAACGGSAGYAVDVHDTLMTSEFVQQKREVGLVRMSLTTKKAEIRKLEEKIHRAEKRLHQQQEQLSNTREKFNSFLKFSNLEQDAAVRRADDETRSKHAKTIEIKKLSALISHAEAEMRKTRVQIENCVAYKDFLEILAKPQWFYDTLSNLRIEDATEKILLDAEEAYQARSASLTAQEAARLEAAQQAALAKERDEASSGKRKRPCISTAAQRKGRYQANATPVVEAEEPKVVPLEEQLEHLYASVEEEARAAIAAATASIRAEVGAMTLVDVKDDLHHNYEEKRLPLCFTSVDDLLEVFINVEEGNLFLIQNCHELEEELEGVEMGYMQEREEMSAMVDQRTAQLEALTSSVAEAQKKLQALDERMMALEPHGNVQATAPAGATATTSKRARAGASSVGGAWDAAGVASATKMPPEELKKKVEESIEHIFHLLRTGDQQLKLTAQNPNLRKSVDGAKVAGNASHGRSRAASLHRGPKALQSSTMQTGKMKAATGGSSYDSQRPSSGAHRSGKSTVGATTAAGAADAASQQQHHDASMGPVEMLTIIENKLEEYHRYLSDPANHVELALMKAVMKQSDKQRRRQARIIHLANQEDEQEERIRRALERSQAPIIHKIGKPFRPRSFVSKPIDEKSRRKAERAAAALNGSLDNIDSDEDGAEFFM